MKNSQTVVGIICCCPVTISQNRIICNEVKRSINRMHDSICLIVSNHVNTMSAVSRDRDWKEI